MHVTIIHNPRAGAAGLGKRELVEQLKAAGFRVRYKSIKKDGWKAALDEAPGLVLAVGGDGTVAKAARRLAGTLTPLAAIPLGTANNIGRTLGVHGDAASIIASLATARRVPTDLGTITGGPRMRHFIEAVGVGLVPALIAESDRRKPDVELAPEEDLRQNVALATTVLAHARPIGVRLHADGRDISGDYLLVQVMNTQSVGPRLVLAPGADMHDGLFDVIALPASSRDAAVQALSTGVPWTESRVPAVRTRAARVELAWSGTPMHIDDDVWPGDERRAGGEHAITAEVAPGSLLTVLD